MTLVLILLLLVVLAAFFYLVRPLERPVSPFPPGPRREELQSELEVLKARGLEAQGEERKRILVQMVLLERQLAEMGTGSQPSSTSSLSRTTMVILAVLAVTAFVVLVRQTLPRLPGETTVTARNEARELLRLEQKAKTSGKTEDWLKYANQAWDLQDFQRAADGYIQVAKLEPKNLTALRRFGILLFFSGQNAEAKNVLELSTSVDPKEPEGWLFLGNIYFQDGQNQKAIDAWRKYLEAGGEAKEQVGQLIETARAQLGAPAKPGGEQVFLQRCAVCHGAKGQGGSGPRLAGNPVVRVPGALREIVTKGRGVMPAQSLSESELLQLFDFLRGL